MDFQDRDSGLTFRMDIQNELSGLTSRIDIQDESLGRVSGQTYYTTFLSQTLCHPTSIICHLISVIQHLPFVICQTSSNICHLSSTISWPYIWSQLILCFISPSLTLKISILFIPNVTWNHLCFFISIMPSFWYPSLSVGLSRQNLLIRLTAFLDKII